MVLFQSADAALRAAIWRRFAETSEGDGRARPRTCPTMKNKIVFGTYAAAIGAARELERLDGSPRAVHSHGGHWHLTHGQPNEEAPHGGADAGAVPDVRPVDPHP